MKYGVVFEAPPQAGALEAPAADYGSSWILLGLLAVFVVAALRYRKNSRYLSVMMQEVTEVRERHNAFDDTVRETTFVWLLNILWCGVAGILLFGLLFPEPPLSLFPAQAVRQMGVCIGMAAAYTLFLTLAYAFVGNLFSDSPKAALWVKGYLASQGLLSISLFPVALLGLCLPGVMHSMVIIGIILFILAKILFIYKGFCIFFTHFASWVLFLYYLCSLEIVPLVLTYVSARYLCSLV